MHPKLEPILSETYGIMIYQEQVQQAARDLAGYTLGGADILRRAMGKKIKEEMDAQRQKFTTGAHESNDISSQLAGDIFDQIAAFAGYGFNKSHAAAYALVTYRTAWLKANYPVEFFAASMALDSHNTDKLGIFRQDCLHKKSPFMALISIIQSLRFLLKETVRGFPFAMHLALSKMWAQRQWPLFAKSGETMAPSHPLMTSFAAFPKMAAINAS